MKKEEEKKEEIIEKKAEEASPDQASDYDFIREKIRERPINRKKLVRRTLFTAGMAVLFGLVACITFIFLQPLFSRMLSSDEDMELKVVSFPEQNEEEESPQVQVLPPDEDDPEQLVIETPIQQMSLSDEDVVSANQAEQAVSDNEADEDERDADKPDQAPQVIVEQVPLEPEDYRQLYRKLYALSTEVNKSLVRIVSIPEDVDWIGAAENFSEETIGLIIAENGQDLLILANSGQIDKDAVLNAVFCDGARGELYEKAIDPDTGLGVYGIALSSMKKETKDAIQVATLGSSYASSILGNAVMAVGFPIGTSSICYGAVTSTDKTVSMRDASYQLLTTDIYGSRSASGVIVNIRGQIAGIICQDHNDSGMENMIYAYGISSIRKLIENLSNGRTTAYLGLRVGEVSPEVAEKLGIPQGVYINQVEMDSPAMSAGLARGDIIQKIGDINTNNITEYMSVIQNTEPESEVELVYARFDGEEYRSMKLTIVLGSR
ncbi:MAG: PDZ domain-containing protein [Lachnospiraceae bacterium]|nr:PDZ domain-containing protein [Lachnospiraceae bacterium]